MRPLPAVDRTLASFIIVLVVFGLLTLTSASSVVAFERYGDAYYFVKRQIIWLLLGLAALWVGSRIPYGAFRRQAPLMLLLSVGLLILVLIPGLGIRLLGAQRWINLGVFSFQPSEVVKLTFLLYLASWLDRRRLGGRGETGDTRTFLLLLSVIGGLMLLQPDLGTLVVLAGIALAVYFAAGAPHRSTATIIGLGVAALLLAAVVAPYRFNRLTTFLNPAADPQGEGYHITQSLIALGSGGPFGLGLGHSRQKFNYLPEASSDSIFAIIGEELGFVVSAAVVAIFFGLTIRGYRVAERAPDGFGRSVAVGITFWFAGQSLLNMGALTGLLPLTGVPLPFISYGGTSIIVLLFAAGIVLNVSRASAMAYGRDRR